MGLLQWIFKSKREMAKPDTKRVRLGKYTVSSHAQNRIVDQTRKLNKQDMLVNLFGRDSKNSKIYVRDYGKQYDRINDKNMTITHITDKDLVKTIYHFDKKKRKNKYKNF